MWPMQFDLPSCYLIQVSQVYYKTINSDSDILREYEHWKRVKKSYSSVMNRMYTVYERPWLQLHDN